MCFHYVKRHLFIFYLGNLHQSIQVNLIFAGIFSLIMESLLIYKTHCKGACFFNLILYIYIYDELLL